MGKTNENIKAVQAPGSKEEELTCRVSANCTHASASLRISALVDAVGVARSGAESVKPILQQLYRTRAAAYQEAVSSFVQGYREGFAGLPDSDDVADESPKGSPSDASRAPPADSQGRGQGSAAELEASAEREPLHEKGSTHVGSSANLKPLRAGDSLDENAAGKILRPSTAANDGESRLRHGTSGMHD